MNKKVMLYNCYRRPFGKIGKELIGTGSLVKKISKNFSRVKLQYNTNLINSRVYR